MNIKLCATAVSTALAIVSGAAQAYTPWLTAPQEEVFISGSSGPSNMMREQVMNNVCDPTKPIDVFADALGAPSPTQIMEHQNQWAVACEAGAGLTNTAAGTRIMVRKSDVGGSGNGTTPVDEMKLIQFMTVDGVNCSATPDGSTTSPAGGAPYNYHLCGTATHLQIPDAGSSDIEPGKFTGPLAPTTGGDFKGINMTAADIFPGPGLIFGIGVTKQFRDELQADQIASGALPSSCVVGDEGAVTGTACMPSLTDAYITALFSGKISQWSDSAVLNGQAPNVPAGMVSSDDKNRVHFCRRVKGSGTHAEFMIHYMRTNCAKSGTPSILSQPGGGFFGTPFVYENSSSGTLGSCLDALDTGAGKTGAKITPDLAAGVRSFGIGYQSTEKNMGLLKSYRFVKINGVAPTLENAYDGMYRQIYYLSFQHRTGGNFQAGPNRLGAIDSVGGVGLFSDAYQNIDGNTVRIINAGLVHSWGRGGFLAPAVVSTPTAFNPVGAHVTPWVRSSGGSPDSCQKLNRKI